MQKKKNCFSSFFSRSGRRSLPQPYPEKAPFLSNPDTRGLTSSSQPQRIPSFSYIVPTASDHINKTATEENVKVDLDGLITHISKLFEFKEGKISSYEPKAVKQYWPTSQNFINLKKLLNDGINYSNNIGVNSKTVISSILQGMGSANNLVAVGFLVVANILERIDDVRANRIECLSLLKEMAKLAKVVKDFKERAYLRQKMNDEIKDATTLIVEGSLMCCTQIDSSKFSKFFNTSVNKDELLKIKKELDTVYRDLQNKMGFFTFENTEKIKEKINDISNQKEVLDQRRTYHEHPGHGPPPPLGPIIIYAHTVNLQTGALPSTREYPSQLPYISGYPDGFPAPAQVPSTSSRSNIPPGGTRSNVETAWKQEQAQGVQQKERGSGAGRNDPEEKEQGRQPTITQTLVGVQTKEQQKSFAEKKGAIERREEQPLRKTEEDKRKEQERQRQTKEADERKERDDEVKKTKAKIDKNKTEEEVKRDREAETKKPATAVQPQKGQNPEDLSEKRISQKSMLDRRDPSFKR